MIRSAILLPIIFGVLASPILATETPTFPSCEDPSGTLKVDYPGGEHALVGSDQLHQGSDQVYNLDETTLYQCFCPPEGDPGTQTNWWQIDDFTQEQIDLYKKLGWYFIPSGAAWGLNHSPYLAQNTDFQCQPTPSPTPTPTPTPTPGPDPTPTPTPGESGPTPTPTETSGTVESTSTGGTVLGASNTLPATGNSTAFYLFLLGLLFLSTGLVLRQTHKTLK